MVYYKVIYNDFGEIIWGGNWDLTIWIHRIYIWSVCPGLGKPPMLFKSLLVEGHTF